MTFGVLNNNRSLQVYHGLRHRLRNRLQTMHILRIYEMSKRVKIILTNSQAAELVKSSLLNGTKNPINVTPSLSCP